MQPFMHELVQDMCSLLLSHAPGSHDKMLHLGACSTFANVYYAVKDAKIAGHLVGTSTISILSIGPADLAGHAPTDSEPVCAAARWRCAQSAAEHGSTCVDSTRRTHHELGGYVWIRHQEVKA
jgi:hypothetical protein